MSENKARRFRFVYGVIFSLITLALGVLMIMQVWSIYRSAESSPYTVESITAHYQKIKLPIWLWVVALGFNVLLALVFPETEKRPKAYVDKYATLKRLRARLPEDGVYALKKHRVFRAFVTATATLLALCTMTVCLSLLFMEGYTPVLDKEIFTQHGAVADRLVRFVPWLVGGFVACLLASGLNALSVKKETNAVKKNIAESAKRKKAPVETAEEPKAERKEIAPTPVEERGSAYERAVDGFTATVTCKQTETEVIFGVRDALKQQALSVVEKEKSVPVLEVVAPVEPKSEQSVKPQKIKKVRAVKEKKPHPKWRKAGAWSLRIALLAVGVFFVVVGIQNGGMTDVFEKAKNICTQCIGLG